MFTDFNWRRALQVIALIILTLGFYRLVISPLAEAAIEDVLELHIQMQYARMQRIKAQQTPPQASSPPQHPAQQGEAK